MQTMANAITAEVTRSNQDPIGHALPVATEWVTGNVGGIPGSINWRPTHQLALIGQGHYILPEIEMPQGGDTSGWGSDYFGTSFTTMASLHLPFTLKGTQFEYALANDPYWSLPAAQNPNVVYADGSIHPKISPFGPYNLWQEVGAAWTTGGAGIQQLQSQYPDPPRVIFLSNNEQATMDWTDLPNTLQYNTVYHTPGTPDLSMEAQRGIVGAGWIQAYRALQAGMRGGLTNNTWKNNSIFAAYDAFGPNFFGQYSDWTNYSLYQKSIPRIDPDPLMWDGGSPSYYTNDWDGSTDYTLWSPQISFMNYPFMQAEALSFNPNFWFEFSVWDGYPGKFQAYQALGQTYDPTRYGGWAQFGMWLNRPRAVREYRDYTTPYDDVRDGDTHTYGDYFMAIVNDVDRVYNNAILTDWWRKGTLVPNEAHQHPFGSSIPTPWATVDRWFLLDCDANPAWPWTDLSMTINVFPLALTRGTAPNRQWLVYAHSPLKDTSNVTITIPNYKNIKVNVTRGGVFYMVDEATGAVQDVTGAAAPYSLVYMAGPNGSVTGTAFQTVNSGASGTAVTAVPASGYKFVQWSDGSTANPRTDTNVTANKSLTATFSTGGAPTQYTLTYTAGANGSITGTKTQTVTSGGSGTAVTAVPATGYHFVQWSDGVLTATRTDTNVTANINVTATFAVTAVQYTLTYTAGANGSISGTTPQTVTSGGSGTAVTAVPATNYHFVQWSDGSTANPRTDTNVTASKSVTATFAINQYTLTYTASANGSISGTTPQTVACGASGTAVTAVPASGCHFVQWSDGILTATRTDTNVTANKSVTASFAVTAAQYTLTYTAGANGSISGTTPQTVASGGSGTAVTAVPATGYHFVQWSDGVLTATRTDTNVTANKSVTASFAVTTVQQYTLTYTAGANGSISGTTPQTVASGGSGTAVTAVPATGYQFAQWSDGILTATRTDANVTANLSVTASFAAATAGSGPATPVLGNPVGQVTTLLPTMSWSAYQSGGDGLSQAGFEVRVRCDTDGDVVVYDTGFIPSTTGSSHTYAPGAFTGTDSVTGVTLVSLPLVWGKQYHWHVRYMDTGGNWSYWAANDSVADHQVFTPVQSTSTFTLKYAAGTHGTLSGKTSQTVASGASGTAVTAVPASGYLFVKWSDGSTANPRTDTNVTANISVSASFAPSHYTLTYTSGTNGTISGTTPQSVAPGGSGTPVTAVAKSGYHFVKWSDGSTANPRTDTNVVANKTVKASFAVGAASSN